jgi:TBC1 domain family member 15
VTNGLGQSESFDPFGAHGDPFWGGDEVIRWLKKYVTVQRSSVEPQLYLIDPTTSDLLSLTPSESGTPPEASSSASMDPLTARLKEARWSLLEKFARVTAFGRRTASDILEQPIVKDQIIPRLPPQMRDIIKSKEVQRYAGEYDSAREYLARWAAGVAEEAERAKGKRGEEVCGIWGSSSGRHSGWEEMTDLGGFEVLSVRFPSSFVRWLLMVDSAAGES